MRGPNSTPQVSGAKSNLWESNYLWGFLLILGTIAAYQPVWHAGFIWDDEVWLMSNPALHHANSLSSLWFHPSTLDYLPVTSTMFWLEWQLWGGDPLGYHLVNVFLHSVSALLFWQVLSRLDFKGAWLAAAVFALLPVNVETVAWIAECKNALSMVFYLTSLWFYLRSDNIRSASYWFSVLSFSLALLSKAAAAPLPLVLLMIEWWRKVRIGKAELLRSAPFFIISVVLGTVAIWVQHKAVGTEVIRTDTFWGRLAGSGWVIWFYLGKALMPLGLMAIYPRWTIDAAAVLSYLPLVLLLGLFGILWHWRARWSRPWLFGLGYFVVMLFPVLGFVNISFMLYSLVADRYQYFSILGLIACTTAGATIILERWNKTMLSRVIASVLLVILGTLTWRQARIYTDSEVFWHSAIAANANCWAGHAALGNTLQHKRKLTEAINEYREAIRLKSDYAEAHNNLANALKDAGKTDEAEREYREALRLKPYYAGAHANLGSLVLSEGRMETALEEFERALHFNPNDADSHNNLGSILLNKGRVQESIAHTREAIRLEPNLAELHANLGNELLANGQVEEAIHEFEETIRLKPQHTQAHYNLGTVLFGKGRFDEAIRQFREVIRLTPQDAEAHYNLGVSLANSGHPAEAVAEFKSAIGLKPEYVEAHNNLAIVLSNLGRIDEAVSEFNEVLRIKPDDQDARTNLQNAKARKAQNERVGRGVEQAEIKQQP